ncbi:hypothetical protein BpHYR1_040102 [Brachionus plicatilis]|uniref:RNA-directed DNA polymerase from mobile element jockey-like n=1 Tax=Brachionus plicatilis TaxID=10195 RepID=A0A3M7T9B6_BRAPC|nr:hypothetical protein BpHYR1_040102 [Brachionus plicatilis]
MFDITILSGLTNVAILNVILILCFNDLCCFKIINLNQQQKSLLELLKKKFFYSTYNFLPFKDKLNLIDLKLDLIIFNETKIDDSIPNSFLKHTDYRIVRRDRKSNGGGILVMFLVTTKYYAFCVVISPLNKRIVFSVKLNSDVSIDDCPDLMYDGSTEVYELEKQVDPYNIFFTNISSNSTIKIDESEKLINQNFMKLKKENYEDLRSLFENISPCCSAGAPGVHSKKIKQETLKTI